MSARILTPVDVAKLAAHYGVPLLAASHEALRVERDRLIKLFDDAGQGEHNVLALVDHYQCSAIDAEARAARLEVALSVASSLARALAMGNVSARGAADALLALAPTLAAALAPAEVPT